MGVVLAVGTAQGPGAAVGRVPTGAAVALETATALVGVPRGVDVDGIACQAVGLPVGGVGDQVELIEGLRRLEPARREVHRHAAEALMKPANLLPRAHRVDRQPAGGVDLLAQGEERLEVLQQWALLVVPGLLPATVLIEEGRGVGHDVVERVQRGRSSS